ncbi:alpha/beta-hydrolase [Basidiobolus meristosporus CBS 931.73]|uniref:Alpha/beta-hydrolase n=1 Tax=Basidiobolus meristosporus CBS 931.73 TaxID=1314790 RepID=A0A1Y1X246_9FUNG|nr:alpha/beta-hydrolase [Basidiobolus meristosporus CBS 931.73]|eukprot:ORX79735.1 alpha/beta-hydrolase [Basidiobolus meristosporus CBS 931.73]
MGANDPTAKPSQPGPREVNVQLPLAHHAATSPYTFAEFLKNTVGSVLKTLYYNYTMLFYDPVNFFTTILIYITLIILMSIVTIVVDLLNKADIIERISEKMGHGLSFINWGSPTMFDEGGAYIERASLYLSQFSTDESVYGNQDDTDKITIQTKNFSPSVAMACTLLSALVYELDDNKPAEKRKRPSMLSYYAAKWNLNFVKASEMKVVGGGPYCGVFVGMRPRPYMVVVFKGTSPFDSAEWLSDATLTRTQASSYVYGEVHSGFFNKLFPQQSAIGRVKRSSPYAEIIHCISQKAKEFQTEGSITEIPLWVTGHSLGAALASLFFARLLKSKDDLDYATTGLVLKDGYTFGCPALGDGRFASEFASQTNLPLNNQSTLWRVVNDADIVARIPPGNDDLDTLRFFTSADFTNYAHIGQSLRLFTDGRNPALQPTRFSSTLFIPNIEIGDRGSLLLKCWHFVRDFLPVGLTNDYRPLREKNVITIGELFIPKIFADHYPSRYFWSLQKSLRFLTKTGTTQPSPSEKLDAPN